MGKNYRNQWLLDLPGKAHPPCMNCGKRWDETVVACHSNQIEDGHGIGIKAHDIVAFLCSECHAQIDGRRERRGGERRMPYREERLILFYHAVYKTWLWLMQHHWLNPS